MLGIPTMKGLYYSFNMTHSISTKSKYILLSFVLWYLLHRICFPVMQAAHSSTCKNKRCDLSICFQKRSLAELGSNYDGRPQPHQSQASVASSPPPPLARPQPRLPPTISSISLSRNKENVSRKYTIVELQTKAHEDFTRRRHIPCDLCVGVPI